MKTQTITIANDVELTFPDGYEATGEFRPPRKGEYFIHGGKDHASEECDVQPLDLSFPGRRFILRKLTPTKYTKYVNLYNHDKIHNEMYDTAEAARLVSGGDLLATATVTYEAQG